MAASAMVLEVERRLGIPIPVGQIYLTPVLLDFAAYLEGQDPDDRAPLYIPLKDKGDTRPLFGRSAYSTEIERWFQADPTKVLGSPHSSINFI